MKGNAYQKVIKQAALSLLVFFAGNTNSYAGSVDIAQTPLFLGAGVQPNIFFVSDDSGSMDWETMMPGYWRYDAYDSDRFRTGDFEDYTATWLDNGTWEAAVFDGDGPATDGAYGYIYGRSGGSTDNVYGNNCDGSYYLGWAEECGNASGSPFIVDWRGRSSGLNKVFFNADINYLPWSGPCGTGDCADATFTNVRSDPYSTQPGYAITRNLETNGNGQGGAFLYDVWIDDSGYTGTRPDSGPSFNETGYAASELETGATGLAADAPNGLVDLWDSHMRITVGSGQVNVQLITYNPVSTAGATEGLNESNSFLNTNLAVAGTCYNVLGTNAMVANIRNQIIGDPVQAVALASATGAEGCRTIAEVRQNAANWFQYYRRRAFPVKNAVAAVIDAQPNFRYGMTLLNENTTSTGDIFIEVPPGGEANVAPHNLSIKESYFSYRQESNGTPLRRALQMAGEYYKGNVGAVDPIKYSCQKNFTILFTDGYWNGSSPDVGDVDDDGVWNTVADVSYLYYGRGHVDGDIYSLMDDNVQIDLPVEADMPVTNPEPDGDGDRTYQHMVTFTVAFGVTGQLVDADDDGEPDVRYDGNPWSSEDLTAIKGGDGSSVGWGPASTGPDKIDDLWHAAYNSGGTYASAATPDEITDKLIKAISNIDRRQSSAAAVALNSGTLNANSRVYQAGFNSSDWSGSLRSIPIQDGYVDENPVDDIDDSPPECDAYTVLGELCIDFDVDGDVGEWDAGQKLAARTTRREIFTFSADNNAGVLFETITDLDAAQQTALRTHPETLTVEDEAVGTLRLNYIRGDDDNEGAADENFRMRNGVVLGDIIHSAPAFVGKPDFFYPDKLESASSYNAFKQTYRERKGIVYVGANDGMLHAFDASNDTTKGEEIFAYVPGKLIDKLPQLTSKSYSTKHTYFVDGSPVSFDAYDGGWKTVLAGSAGAGGPLIYALDITNPRSSFGAANILWEFTDVPRVVDGDTFGDVDLGYTIGDVAYARMNNGRWAVIFGNGYNNTEADGNPSLTGNAAIYVVDAFTGELIKKFDTGVGTAEDPTGAARPNGISRVTPIDTNGDFKADYLYAGDLFGNVWKMDVKSTTDSSWVTDYGTESNPRPFFIAKDAAGVEQSITTAVSVKRHPIKVDETLVLFGTGSYFAVNDSTTTQTQTFYAAWDDGTASQYNRSSMLEQRILGNEVVTGEDGIRREFRLSSSADADPANYQIDWTTDKGWYMDLGVGVADEEEGERVNVEPILRGNRIIFVTLTPDADPCNYGGTSWIMELNSNNGSRLKESPFDVNGNGIIGPEDTIGTDEDVTSGVRSKEGIVAKPGILNTKGKKELKFLSGTSGKIDTVTESINEDMRDRQSWRQLR